MSDPKANMTLNCVCEALEIGDAEFIRRIAPLLQKRKSNLDTPEYATITQRFESSIYFGILNQTLTAPELEKSLRTFLDCKILSELTSHLGAYLVYLFASSSEKISKSLPELLESVHLENVSIIQISLPSELPYECNLISVLQKCDELAKFGGNAEFLAQKSKQILQSTYTGGEFTKLTRTDPAEATIFVRDCLKMYKTSGDLGIDIDSFITSNFFSEAHSKFYETTPNLLTELCDLVSINALVEHFCVPSRLMNLVLPNLEKRLFGSSVILQNVSSASSESKLHECIRFQNSEMFELLLCYVREKNLPFDAVSLYSQLLEVTSHSNASSLMSSFSEETLTFLSLSEKVQQTYKSNSVFPSEVCQISITRARTRV